MTLWRWFQDWRERRTALAEMDQFRRADEAVLRDQNQNPLNLAKLSVDSNPVEAAAQWERARRLMPNAVLESEDSPDILIKLKRFDEAVALMHERQKRFPGDRFSLMSLAKIADYRGDTEEALKRWEVVRNRVRDSVFGYLGVARCLGDLGRFEEAETQLDRAHRRDPDSHEVRVARARLSDRRQDWEQSISRWQHAAESIQDPPAFAFAAKAMIELGRLDEAEAYLKGPAIAHPNEFEIAFTRAVVAQSRGDLTAACDRWAMVRAMKPQFPLGYQNGAARLVEAGRHADADVVMRAAIERFPDQIWPWRDFAYLAHDRKDWAEAAVRWEAMRQRFPTEEAGYSLGAEALKAAGRDEAAAALRCPT